MPSAAYDTLLNSQAKMTHLCDIGEDNDAHNVSDFARMMTYATITETGQTLGYFIT